MTQTQYAIGTYKLQPRTSIGRWASKSYVSSRFIAGISLTVAVCSFVVASIAVRQAIDAREEMITSQKAQLINIGAAENMMVERFGRMIRSANDENAATFNLMLDTLTGSMENMTEARAMVIRAQELK